MGKLSFGDIIRWAINDKILIIFLFKFTSILKKFRTQ